MTRLNDAANTLNTRLSERAATAGFIFVSVTTPFIGHAVCDRSPWLHNVSLTTPTNSFHPNLAGHTGYATTISPSVPSITTTASPSIRTGGTTSSDTRRGQVRAPNLRSAEAEAAARKAGISEADLDLLADAQERGASNNELTALEEQVVRRAKK